MELISGVDCRVLVGKNYSAKVARSNPKAFLRYASQIRQERGLKSVVDMWRSESADSFMGMKWHLFHGIVANRRERRLAKSFDVVTPTRSLLFGLVNIQPTSEELSADEYDISNAFIESFEQPGIAIPRLGHMLENVSNLGVYNGNVLFRGGGERGLDRTLETEDGAESVRRALGILSVVHSETQSI